MKKILLIASASAFGASALTFIAFHYLRKRSEAKENIYETETLLGRYLVIHYGKPEDILPHGFGPRDSLEFPARCALECIKHTKNDVPSIALDIGCSVGRATFELAKRFNQVVGIDFSHGFINAANKLKTYGKLAYTVQTEGSLVSEHVAQVDPDIDRSHVSFYQGDACNLPSDLGQFGCVLAANVVCRLPNPYQFLERLPSLVAPGGTLVMTLPNSWMEQFTPKCHWLGGFKDAEGKNVHGTVTVKRCLEPYFELIEEKHMSFMIRETARQNQLHVADAVIWKRRTSS